MIHANIKWCVQCSADNDKRVVFVSQQMQDHAKKLMKNRGRFEQINGDSV